MKAIDSIMMIFSGISESFVHRLVLGYPRRRRGSDESDISDDRLVIKQSLVDLHSYIFPVSASRPAGLPRYGGGALNAGQAWINLAEIVLNLPDARGQAMMKYIIPLAVLFIMAGSAFGTMWLYTDPTFFQMGTPVQSASLRLNNVSNLETAGALDFPLLGQGFYRDAIPVRLTNNTNTIQIGSKGLGAMAPVSVTFGGHTENNLKYAQSKSSLRIGQPGSWTTLNTPGTL